LPTEGADDVVSLQKPSRERDKRCCIVLNDLGIGGRQDWRAAKARRRGATRPTSFRLQKWTTA